MTVFFSFQKLWKNLGIFSTLDTSNWCEKLDRIRRFYTKWGVICCEDFVRIKKIMLYVGQTLSLWNTRLQILKAVESFANVPEEEVCSIFLFLSSLQMNFSPMFRSYDFCSSPNHLLSFKRQYRLQHHGTVLSETIPHQMVKFPPRWTEIWFLSDDFDKSLQSRTTLPKIAWKKSKKLQLLVRIWVSLSFLTHVQANCEQISEHFFTIYQASVQKKPLNLFQMTVVWVSPSYILDLQLSAQVIMIVIVHDHRMEGIGTTKDPLHEEIIIVISIQFEEETTVVGTNGMVFSTIKRLWEICAIPRFLAPFGWHQSRCGVLKTKIKSQSSFITVLSSQPRHAHGPSTSAKTCF